MNFNTLKEKLRLLEQARINLEECGWHRTKNINKNDLSVKSFTYGTVFVKDGIEKQLYLNIDTAQYILNYLKE